MASSPTDGPQRPRGALQGMQKWVPSGDPAPTRTTRPPPAEPWAYLHECQIKAGFDVLQMSASDAVDGSHRRHLGAIEWLVLMTTLKG